MWGIARTHLRTIQLSKSQPPPAFLPFALDASLDAPSQLQRPGRAEQLKQVLAAELEDGRKTFSELGAHLAQQITVSLPKDFSIIRFSFPPLFQP